VRHTDMNLCNIAVRVIPGSQTFPHPNIEFLKF